MEDRGGKGGAEPRRGKPAEVLSIRRGPAESTEMLMPGRAREKMTLSLGNGLCRGRIRGGKESKSQRKGKKTEKHIAGVHFNRCCNLIIRRGEKQNQEKGTLKAFNHGKASFRGGERKREVAHGEKHVGRGRARGRVMKQKAREGCRRRRASERNKRGKERCRESPAVSKGTVRFGVAELVKKSRYKKPSRRCRDEESVKDGRGGRYKDRAHFHGSPIKVGGMWRRKKHKSVTYDDVQEIEAVGEAVFLSERLS